MSRSGRAVGPGGLRPRSSAASLGRKTASPRPARCKPPKRCSEPRSGPVSTCPKAGSKEASAFLKISVVPLLSSRTHTCAAPSPSLGYHGTSPRADAWANISCVREAGGAAP